MCEGRGNTEPYLILVRIKKWLLLSNCPLKALSLRYSIVTRVVKVEHSTFKASNLLNFKLFTLSSEWNRIEHTKLNFTLNKLQTTECSLFHLCEHLLVAFWNICEATNLSTPQQTFIEKDTISNLVIPQFLERVRCGMGEVRCHKILEEVSFEFTFEWGYYVRVPEGWGSNGENSHNIMTQSIFGNRTVRQYELATI